MFGWVCGGIAAGAESPPYGGACGKITVACGKITVACDKITGACGKMESPPYACDAWDEEKQKTLMTERKRARGRS